jgi:lipopolysaccharide transport system permease protein
MSPHKPAWIRSLGPLVQVGLRQRYAGSWLGSIWAILGPLVEVAAYVALFSLLLPSEEGADHFSFALHVAAGLLPWVSFREAVDGAALIMTENRWIRRSSVPLELLVARQVGLSGVRGLVGLLLVLATAALAGRAPGVAGFALPFVGLALQLVATYGISLGVAPLAVVFPDLRPGLASALTLLTFASPIVFPESIAGERVLALLEWNPYTHFLRLFRASLTPAPASSLWVSALAAATALGAGHFARHRLWWVARDRL